MHLCQPMAGKLAEVLDPESKDLRQCSNHHCLSGSGYDEPSWMRGQDAGQLRLASFLTEAAYLRAGFPGETSRRRTRLEEGTAAHSIIFAWRIPWTKEPCGLQSMGSQSQTQLMHTPCLRGAHSDTHSGVSSTLSS